MTKKFIEQQKSVLVAALDRLNGVNLHRVVSNPGEEGGADLGDVSAAITAADTALSLASNAINTKIEIQRALVKIEKGTYGMCEFSGEPIGEDHLEAIPWARYSIAAQIASEKGRPIGSRNHRGNLFDDASKSTEEEEPEEKGVDDRE